jgi:hypothetical protein
LLDDLSQTVKEDDTMPFGLFLLIAGILIFPGFASGERDIRDTVAVRHNPEFGIITHVSNQNNFIYASTCHFCLPD